MLACDACVTHCASAVFRRLGKPAVSWNSDEWWHVSLTENVSRWAESTLWVLLTWIIGLEFRCMFKLHFYLLNQSLTLFFLLQALLENLHFGCSSNQFMLHWLKISAFSEKCWCCSADACWKIRILLVIPAPALGHFWKIPMNWLNSTMQQFVFQGVHHV